MNKVNGEFQRLDQDKMLIFLKRLDTEITLHLRPLHAGDRSAETAIVL
jgi:predicted XRE-type DNA-binding protein